MKWYYNCCHQLDDIIQNFILDNSSSPQSTPQGLKYGDMRLTKMQEFVFKQNNKAFNAIPDPTRRWKDAVIPYKIDCSIGNIIILLLVQ